MAGGTSYVCTPVNRGKGPAEHDIEEDVDEEDEDEDYDKIGMSHLGDAPFSIHDTHHRMGVLRKIL